MDSFKRKNYLPKKSFQLRLMGKIYLAIVIIVIILSGSIYLVNTKSIADSKNEIRSELTKFAQTPEDARSGLKYLFEVNKLKDGLLLALGTLESNMFKAFAASILLSLVIVMTIFLVLSHRIAGPIYRFEQTLIAVREGDLSVRINLRGKDELKELADHFNNMTITLNQKMNDLQKTITVLHDILNNNTKLTSAERDALNENIAKAAALINQFKIAYN